MTRRFLNVEFSGTLTRIDVTTFEDLSEIRRAIKIEYGNEIPVSPALIQIFNQQGQHIKSWALLKSLPEEYYAEDGYCLVIKTKPSGIDSYNIIGMTAMEIDSSTSETSFAQKIYEHEKELKQLFETEKLSAIKLSILKPLNSLLKLDIPSSNGVPDLLSCERIYSDLKKYGVDMPVDKLIVEMNGIQTLNRNATVLIGVSGCGKSRTCFDICHKIFGLYYDCIKDVELNFICDSLKHILSSDKKKRTMESHSQFELEAKRYLECLITTRLFVLKQLLEMNTTLSPSQWLLIQREVKARGLFNKIYSYLNRLPWKISHEFYRSMASKFSSECVVIFDESQFLLGKLETDFCSLKPENRGIKDGQFENPRSFFTFVIDFITNSQFKSVWCGTEMRIKNVDLVYSAAAGKPDEIQIFTEFNYLDPGLVKNLLSEWLNVALKPDVMHEICHFLQGRPRVLMAFITEIFKSQSTEFDASTRVETLFKQYQEIMTTIKGQKESADISFYAFWNSRIKHLVSPFFNADQSQKQVLDLLLILCISFLFGNGETMSFASDIDILVTGLVMVNKIDGNWTCRMAEPLVLTAGMNALSDYSPNILLEFFSKQMFTPVTALYPTVQYRGTLIEMVVALRTLQAWWREDAFKTLLPKWVIDLDIPKPRGIIDARQKTRNSENQFILQLRDQVYPYVLLPPSNAGPDIRYSVFSFSIKTTWTPNSKSTMYVAKTDCEKNISTMNPNNWYAPEPEKRKLCQYELENLNFLHLRFELPDTAPSLYRTFESDFSKPNSVICVNLKSPFALAFFGESFIQKYNEFISNRLQEYS